MLSGNEIVKRKIIKDMIDEKKQMQPAGYDLTVKNIGSYASIGEVDFDNSKRKLPRIDNVGKLGDVWKLSPGTYSISFNETVTVPLNCVGFAWPRSTLLRMGADMHTAIFDSGYSGKPIGMLTVFNKNGMIVHPNARLLQIVFIQMDHDVTPYNGEYQGEGIA